jgi:hypothetical protein
MSYSLAECDEYSEKLPILVRVASRLILSKSLNDPLKQALTYVADTDVWVLGISSGKEHSALLGRHSTVILRAHADNNLARERLPRKLERILLRWAHRLNGKP